MKKLFFFAAFLLAASLTTVNAQCTKTAGAKTACCAKTKAATAKAMSADASIEKRVCAESGKVAYFRNSKCEVSGKMTSQEVKLDDATGTFVNVSPERAALPAADGAKKSCTAAEKAACGMKTKTALKADAPAKATFTKGESN
jgi:hypothetical protein